MVCTEQYHAKKKECVDLADEINQLKKEIETVNNKTTPWTTSNSHYTFLF